MRKNTENYVMSHLSQSGLEYLRRHISRNKPKATRFYGWMQDVVNGEYARRIALETEGIENPPEVIGGVPLFESWARWSTDDLAEASIAIYCISRSSQNEETEDFLSVIELHHVLLVNRRLQDSPL